MATRLYLPSSGAPLVAPAFDGAWDVTTGADRVRAVANGLSGTAMASKATAETTATPCNVLSRQYVAGPLKAGEIAGTVKGVIRAQEAATDADYRAQLVIRVVSADGSTVRGTLRAADGEALSSEWGTGLANRAFPLAALSPQALTAVTAQAGDWLVVEIGYRSHNEHTTSRAGTLRYGDSAASDCAENETATSDYNPWIEFSQTIPMQEIAVRQVVGEIAYRATGQQVQVRQVVGEIAYRYGEFAAPIEVAPTAGAVAFAGGASTTQVGVTLGPTAGDLLLAGPGPVISTILPIQPSIGAVGLSGGAALLTVGVTLSATVGTMALGPLDAAVRAGVGVTAGTGGLGLLEASAGVGAGAQILPLAGDLALAGLPVRLDWATLVQPSTGAVALTGLGTDLSVGVGLQPASGAVTLDAAAPLFSAGVAVQAPTGLLALGGKPVVLRSGASVQPGAGLVALGGAGPNLLVTVILLLPTGEMVLAGEVPLALVLPYLRAPLKVEVLADWGVLGAQGEMGIVELDAAGSTVEV